MKEIKSTSDKMKPAQEESNRRTAYQQIIENASIKWAEEQLKGFEFKRPNLLGIEEQIIVDNSKDRGHSTSYEKLSLKEIFEVYGDYLSESEKEQLIKIVEDGRNDVKTFDGFYYPLTVEECFKSPE